MAFSKSKTSFAKTDRVLNRLIRMAIQSGAFTGACASINGDLGSMQRAIQGVFALGTLLMFRLFPDTQMLTLFALPIGRIYTHVRRHQ